MGSASAFGAPENIISQLKTAEEKAFPVWQENWQTLTAFLMICGQLRYRPDGLLLGFDSTAVKAELDMASIKLTAVEYQGLKTMESTITEYINEQRS